MSQTVSKFLASTDGTTIYAEATGNPENNSIIFVHGLSLSSIVFDKIFTDERLLKEFYLVRYDMRGHGRSGKPETPQGHASNLWANDFMVVLRAFGLKKPVHFGWSLGASIATDYCQYVEPLPVSGLVYASALPFIGPIQAKIGTPVIRGFVPALLNTEDVALSRRTAISFVDSVFSDPESVPQVTKCAWIGALIMQSPAVAKLVLTRKQDPTTLFEKGSQGLPLLLLSGTLDAHVKGPALVTELQAHFKNMEVKMIEGGGHAVFYDKQDEVVEALVMFARRVSVRPSCM